MMRRLLIVLLSLFIPLLILAGVWAQDDNPDAPLQPGVPIAHHPPQMLSADPTVTLQTDDGENIVLTTVDDASNNCLGAAIITVPGGGSTTVNGFDTGGDDPNLACSWDSPKDPKGYRTAWYQFTATNHGTITIDTLGSNYDTVLSVFDATGGTCTADSNDMALVACNDDNNGFSSRVQFTAVKDTTYYIQVADWQLGASGNATLQLSLEVESINSSWEQMGAMPKARSRHATAIIGNNIYVIGGQTVDFDPFGKSSPTIINSFDKYNTVSKTWTSLPDLPDASGYSNTTAVYANTSTGTCNDGCIFVPGGYTGGTSYDGTHWAYDFGANLWVEKASIGDPGEPDWPDGVPFAWSAAVTAPDHLGYYLIGGLSSQPPISNTTALVHDKVFYYEIATNKFSDTNKSLGIGRYGHTAAYVNGKICIIGGIEASGILTPNGLCLENSGWETMVGGGLETARYGAGSSVGPDGKWYVYGGADGFSQAVSSVEVFDPSKQDWITLDVSYDLGVTDGLPPRVWPRGGFVGNHLWAIGGNDSLTTNNRVAIPEMERLFIGQYNLMLPIMLNGDSGKNDHLGEADPIAFNTTVSHKFDGILDFYNVYTFDLSSTSSIIVKLRDIPNNSDYNVYVYDANKRLWGTGNEPSNQNETVSLTLASGTYYVIVERAFPAGFPNTKKYRLTVEK